MTGAEVLPSAFMSASEREPAAGTARVLVTLAIVAVGLGLAAATTAPARRRVVAADLQTRLIAAAAGAIVVAVVVYAASRIVLRRSTRPVRNDVLTAVVACAAAIGALGAVAATNADPSPTPSPTPTEGVSGTAEGQTPSDGTGRLGPRPSDDGPVVIDIDTEGTVILIVALSMLGSALVFFSRRTALRVDERTGVYVRSTLRLTEPDDEPGADDLADVLRSSLAALESSGSPRDQIRAAYAAMTERFDTIGLGRRSSETPGAYIDRCLRSNRLPAEPVGHLLRLFELARFSTAPVGPDDVDAARAALHDTLRHVDRAPV